jgi:glycosyltransferase involved in cell wall biosynthesis
MSTDWVAYVGPFLFPWGQPGSRRVYGIARSLAGAGHHVVVAGGADQPATPTALTEVDGPGSVSYVGLGELPTYDQSRLARYTQAFLRWGQKTVDWLDAQPTRPSHVVVYGGGAPYLIRLRRWCRLHRVPLIADVVEWYQASHMPGGYFGPPHLSASIALRQQSPRCDGVIAISSYLTSYFRDRGTKVIRVPPTVDTQAMAVEPRNTAGGLVFAYAGTPGRKDLLATMVRAVDRFAGAGGQAELRILGPTPDQVRELLGGQPLPPAVRALGPLPQPDVAQALRDADFSLLLREPARFSQAGFPTKFGESLATGTPVITNLTSDIGDYLDDGRDGLVCADHTEAALLEALWRAQRLTGAQRTAMRVHARQRAERSFDFRVYEAPLGAFFNEVRAGDTVAPSPARSDVDSRASAG